jgi:predicted alpha/beta-hydrolase family hydrolase
MRSWAARLRDLGEVETLDYPYALAGRRRPDPLPALVAAHRDALRAARARHPGPAVLAGKSMGSRVGCHVALEEPVDALVCLGYPLVGATGAVRDEVLLALRTPVLFVQGTRDRLCPLDRLETVRARMAAPTALHVVEGGDHGLEPSAAALRAGGVTREDVAAAALEAVRTFLAAHVRRSAAPAGPAAAIPRGPNEFGNPKKK